MSKLEELIQQLCPNGVEYKTIGEIAIDIFRGSGIKREQITETGIPCVRYGEIYTTYGVWFDTCISHTDESTITSKKYFEHGDILFAITGESVEDIAKCSAYIGNERCLAGGDIVVLRHNQDPKYLSYALSTTEAQKQKSKGKVKSKVVHSSVPAIKELVVPIPPLEVQQEIVRILDQFTELTTELSTKLDAELTARKKQYAYYRGALLTFDSSTQFERLGDTCNMKAGKAIAARHISPVITNDAPYQCYGGNGVRGYVNMASHHGEFPIIGRQGALCGNVNYANGDFYATEHAVVVESKGKYIQKFLYYLLLSMNLNQYKSQGAQPGLAVGNLENIVAPVPTLEEQHRIISILERFDALCNDLTSGLPAEIKARQKQYEYYRDKLLNFKELK